MGPREVTTTEMAERAGTTPRIIRRWASAGLLPAPKRRVHPCGRGTVHIWPDGCVLAAVALRALAESGLTVTEMTVVVMARLAHELRRELEGRGGDAREAEERLGISLDRWKGV